MLIKACYWGHKESGFILIFESLSEQLGAIDMKSLRINLLICFCATDLEKDKLPPHYPSPLQIPVSGHRKLRPGPASSILAPHKLCPFPSSDEKKPLSLSSSDRHIGDTSFDADIFDSVVILNYERKCNP